MTTTTLPQAQIGKTYSNAPVDLPYWHTYVELLGELPWPHVANWMNDRNYELDCPKGLRKLVVCVSQLSPGMNAYRYSFKWVNMATGEILIDFGQVIGEMVPMRIIGSEADLRKNFVGPVTAEVLGF